MTIGRRMLLLICVCAGLGIAGLALAQPVAIALSPLAEGSSGAALTTA